MAAPASWSDALQSRRPLSALGGAANESRAVASAWIPPEAPTPATSTSTSSGNSGGAEVSTNVKDFGARGDGRTDDTSAFESALASMPRPRLVGGVYQGGGGVLFVPAGTYVIARTILLGPNITLRGEGSGPNLSGNLGATLIDGSRVTVAISAAAGSENVVIEDLSIKDASTAAIRFTGVRHGAIRRVSVLGPRASTGIHLTSATSCSSVEDCNISGISSVPTTDRAYDTTYPGIGLLIDEDCTEIAAIRGAIRHNATNIKVASSSGVLVLGVNCEGEHWDTGLHVLGSEVTCIRNRFEGLGRAVLLELGPVGTGGAGDVQRARDLMTTLGYKGEPMFSGYSNGYHPSTRVGIQDESLTSSHALVEPMICRSATPFTGRSASKLSPIHITDPLRQGMKIGGLHLGSHNEDWVNGIFSSSGKLVLETAGGNALEYRTAGHIVQWLCGDNNPNDGTYAPHSLLDKAGLGSLYSRVDGGGSEARFWVKEQGGAGGWTPIGAVDAVEPSDGRINVRAAPYNAVGNGQHDDTDAIQAALDAAALRLGEGLGGWVWLPRGAYRITRPLVLRGDQAHPLVVEGEPGGHIHQSQAAVLLYDGPDGAPLLRMSDCYRSRVQGIAFLGGQRAESVVEIGGSGQENSFIDCTFNGPRPQAGAACVAVFPAAGADGYQTDLRFLRCVFNAGNGVADGFVVRHTTCARLMFDACTFTGSARGLVVIHNMGVSLRGCNFANSPDFAIVMNDSQLFAEACTFNSARVLRLASHGSASLIGCFWLPAQLPEDGEIISCDGRLQLLGCDFLNQSWPGRSQHITLSSRSTLFSRGSRFSYANSVPIRLNSQQIGGPEGTDDVYKGSAGGPCIDVAGDFGIDYTTWVYTPMPSLLDPAPHLIHGTLPIQADQVSAGHRVLTEGQLVRQVAKFSVPFDVWTSAATEQIHALARPFHRTRIVGAWVEITTAFVGVSNPQVSLGIDRDGERDALLRAYPADAMGLVGASAQDMGTGLDVETAVQGGYLIGWASGQQERLALRLVAQEALGDGSMTRLTAGELAVVVMFEVLP